MQIITVGTAPLNILQANPKRVRWTIQFEPSSIIAGNTGLIYVGRGFIPNAVKGDPNQGEILNPGSAIEEKKQYEGDALPFKGGIWIVSDTAAQSLVMDEQLADPVAATTS